MLPVEEAAKYLVVAWCKDWPLWLYLNTVSGGGFEGKGRVEAVEQLRDVFPWLPPLTTGAYSFSVREFVGGAYPKLSAWLFSRSDDAARLRCAAQVARLRCPDRLLGFVKAEDRKEMKDSAKDVAAATASYRASRAAFKTHQRSAWNVCK